MLKRHILIRKPTQLNAHFLIKFECFLTEPAGPCTDGEIRLENANYDNEGRVQICFGNVWGTVCDTNWGPSEASIVCTQLGFKSAG